MFLVNAAQHSGPALFQGIGMLAAAVWAIWLSSRTIFPNKEEEPEESKTAIHNTGNPKRKFWEYANDPGTRHNEDMKQEEKTNAR